MHGFIEFKRNKINMKNFKTFEEFVNEGKMPKKYIGNDEIVYLKSKEDSKGAHYNLYYKGHDIDTGGRRFGSEKELKDFADNYILSNQLYNKLRYEDSKPLPESFNEPYFKPSKLKNSRLVMKTRDEIESMIRGGKRREVEKLLDKVNDIKNKLQDKYNREQEGHDRFAITDPLRTDMTYLRSYAKIINYLLENI
jgi:hypothetical protein